MKLPESLYFLRPGWWVIHVVGPAAVFVAGVALGTFHASGHGGGGHAHGAPPPPITGDPLKDEMRDLQVAYDRLNAGVILGTTEGIEEAFHAVHARREATAAALEAGTLRPPRNADQLAAFVRQDEAFHGLVERTVDAARAGDVSALRLQAREMQDACVSCHSQFR